MIRPTYLLSGAERTPHPQGKGRALLERAGNGKPLGWDELQKLWEETTLKYDLEKARGSYDVKAHIRQSPDECHVRFGSKADVRTAKRHVRFTPNSDRESGHRQTVMSALSPKADMCDSIAHVCFGPEADMA